MKRSDLAIRKDKTAEVSFEDRTQTEQVMRGDQLLRAAKLLEQEEFAVLKLHDIEGRSLDELQELFGLPLEVIEAQLEELRSRFAHHIQVEARRWRKRLEGLQGDKK